MSNSDRVSCKLTQKTRTNIKNYKILYYNCNMSSLANAYSYEAVERKLAKEEEDKRIKRLVSVRKQEAEWSKNNVLNFKKISKTIRKEIENNIQNEFENEKLLKINQLYDRYNSYNNNINNGKMNVSQQNKLLLNEALKNKKILNKQKKKKI